MAEQPKTFPCSQCGGELQWSPGVQKMKCRYCGTDVDAPREGGFEAREHDLLEFLERHPKAEGYGVQLQQLACKSCGATVQVPPSDRRDLKCPFCDTAYVAEAAAPAEGVVKPESLIPFRFDAAACRSAFGEWIGAGWFRPNNLKALARLDKIAGLYLPFFTFDALAQSAWTAMAGFYYYVTERVQETENGRSVWRDKQVRKVRWEPASGSRRDRYDDVLVPAVQNQRMDLILKVYPYDTKAGLVPYDPAYLAGFGVLNPDMPLKAVYQIARQSMESDQVQRCSGDVPGDTQRDLRVRTDLSEQTFKHVICPLWVGSFRYKGKVYPFVLNGESGKLYGEKPWSWVKITLFTLALVAAGVGLYFLFGRS